MSILLAAMFAIGALSALARKDKNDGNETKKKVIDPYAVGDAPKHKLTANVYSTSNGTELFYIEFVGLYFRSSFFDVFCAIANFNGMCEYTHMSVSYLLYELGITVPDDRIYESIGWCDGEEAGVSLSLDSEHLLSTEKCWIIKIEVEPHVDFY